MRRRRGEREGMNEAEMEESCRRNKRILDERYTKEQSSII